MNWISFLTYVIISAATPGPNTLLSLSCGARYGLKKSMPFQLGIWAGFSIASLLCMAFCHLFSAVIPQRQFLMKILGAAYMVYLAWKLFSSTGAAEENSSGFSFWSGFFFQFMNPNLYLYCIMAMEVYVLAHYQGRWLVLSGFALFLAFMGFFFTVCWAAFGASLQALFSKHGKIINAFLALLLLYCAASLFL